MRIRYHRLKKFLELAYFSASKNAPAKTKIHVYKTSLGEREEHVLCSSYISSIK